METISAKIPEDLKRALEREDINVSETVRKALAAEVKRRRRQQLADDAAALADEISDVVDVDAVVDDLVEEIRETRKKR